MADAVITAGVSEADISALHHALNHELQRVSIGQPSDVSAACAVMLDSRGGLLRGRLLLGASKQGPSPDNAALMAAATAVELLHLASLAHDDVIDSGATRRNRPTIGYRYGQRTAGLAGVSLLARAVELVSLCGDLVVRLFADAAREMCDGGMLELRVRDTQRSVEDCLTTAALKTASNLRLAGRLGAQLSRASDSVCNSTAEFGEALGIAYQLWDDVADIVTDPAGRDKAAVDDLSQGIYNLPVIYALEEHRELRDQLMTECAQDARVLISESAGPRRAVEVADMYAARATELLGSLPKPEALQGLIEEARGRQISVAA
jgi:heptaprenyl diphosphate synthase